MSLPTFYVPADPSEPGAIPKESIPSDHKVRMLAAGAEEPTAPTVKPVKLGRKAPRGRAKCLSLAAYIDRSAAAPLPASCDHYSKAAASIKQMLGNGGPNGEGDCVLASTGHGEGIASGNDTGTPVLSSDSEMLNEYHRVCGPGDNGCNIEDVLNEWQSNGITIGGQKRRIDGWVAVDSSRPDDMKTAVLVFGSMRIGFNVPAEYMNTPDGGTWDTPRSYNFVGGHDVRIIDFRTESDGTTSFRIATWAGTRWFTQRAMTDSRIVDEAYVELMPDWSGSDGVAPNGIKVDELRADLAAWKQGTIPVWSPVSPPPPPGPPPPPPPVTTPPNYVGQFKSGLWNSTYTVILSPVAAFHAPAAFGPVVPWFTVIMDGFTLFRAVMSRDVAGIITALVKLAADFGLTFAPHRVGNNPEIVWADLISAVRKLVADLLTAWTSGLPLNVLWADLQAVFTALRS